MEKCHSEIKNWFQHIPAAGATDKDIEKLHDRLYEAQGSVMDSVRIRCRSRSLRKGHGQSVSAAVGKNIRVEGTRSP